MSLAVFRAMLLGLVRDRAALRVGEVRHRAPPQGGRVVPFDPLEDEEVGVEGDPVRARAVARAGDDGRDMRAVPVGVRDAADAGEVGMRARDTPP